MDQPAHGKLMPSLHIFILCHNRPDDARQAIASVLAQTDTNYTLTISDNSSNDSVEHMVRENFPQVVYVRRQPMLRAEEHFYSCITEGLESDYFVLFHDDDLMAPDYVRAMRDAVLEYPIAIAIGCNALTEINGVIQKRTYFAARRPYEIITDSKDLSYRYFGRGQSGIAPFPGYLYKSEGVGSSRPPLNDGKYGDVIWLLSLADKGPIIWVRKPLMTYRFHGGNNGLQESRYSRLRILGHIKRNRGRWGLGLLEDYRCSFIYKPMLRGVGSPTPARRQVAATFLRRYRWARYLRMDTYQSLIHRALVKWASRT
ncbi:MAG: glycosyltransferase family 2 protein [Curvibacter sp.]|jgi:glycosyltransferase involved in cell wall biosynthesis